MVTSLSTVAQQARTLPSSRSTSIRANGEASPTSTSPSTTCTLQVPQVPCPQANGNHTPCRRAAWRMVWSSSTSICSPIGSIVTLWLITLPSVSDVSHAVQAGGGHCQHAFVVDALSYQAGICIRGERLIVQQPFGIQEVRLGRIRVRRSCRLEDFFNQGTESHVRLHQQRKRRAEHQVIRPVDIQQLHAIEVLDFVFGLEFVVV